MINDYNQLIKRLDIIQTKIKQFNTKKDQGKIQLLLNELNTYKKTIENVVGKKITRITPHQNNKISKMEKKLQIYSHYIELNNIVKDYKEYLNFNLLLYNTNHPYSLEQFNKDLLTIINQLEKLNISITESDFDYSTSVHEYMLHLYQNRNQKNFDQNMKIIFDNLYWNNHNILSDIIINIQIYLDKHSSIIHSIILNQKNDFVTKNSIEETNVYKEYNKLLFKITEFKRSDPYFLVQKFKNNIHRIDDFRNIDTNIESLIPILVYEKYDIDEKEAFLANVYSLYNDINEYKNYEEYKFLINRIKMIYDQKEYTKNTLKAKNTRIHNLILNKKSLDTKIKLFNQMISKSSKINLKITSNLQKKAVRTLNTNLHKYQDALNQITIKIKSEYDNYEYINFVDQVSNKIDCNCTIYEALMFYKNNYVQTLKTFKDNYQENYKTKIDEFYTFLNSPYIKIIKTVSIFDKQPLNQIIEDKYKLFDFEIKLNKIDTKNFQELEHSCYILSIYRNIILSQLTVEDINLLINCDNIE